MNEQTKSMFKPITESTDRTTSSVQDLKFGLNKVNLLDPSINQIDKTIDTVLKSVTEQKDQSA